MIAAELQDEHRVGDEGRHRPRELVVRYRVDLHGTPCLATLVASSLLVTDVLRQAYAFSPTAKADALQQSWCVTAGYQSGDSPAMYSRATEDCATSAAAHVLCCCWPDHRKARQRGRMQT